MKATQDDITRSMLDKIRSIQASESPKYGMINEAKESEQKAIAITDDPRFGQNVLTNQIEQFRSIVEGGADLSRADGPVSEAPLIYIPRDKNLVYSGVIPCLNNLKWQFVLNTDTGNGCFLWAEKLILNPENIKILNKLFGFYQNWRDEWNTEKGDLERMAKFFNENE
jgi:hypothetical protein